LGRKEELGSGHLLQGIEKRGLPKWGALLSAGAAKTSPAVARSSRGAGGRGFTTKEGCWKMKKSRAKGTQQNAGGRGGVSVAEGEIQGRSKS